MKTLYLTYENVFTTGILQAQVVELLKHLKSKGVDPVLFSVNKTGEQKLELYKKNKESFDNLGIQLYEFEKTIGKKQSIFRFVLDIIPMISTAIKVSREVDVIHARSYGAAVIARVCKLITGKPYIFDMRGVLPEEIVRVGKVSRDSLKFKLIKLVERNLIANANYVFSVSEQFSDYIKSEFEIEKVFNISNPTVLKRSNQKDLSSKQKVNFLYSGSAQPWHLVDTTLSVFKEIYLKDPSRYHLSICTSNIDEFERKVLESGLPRGAVDISQKPYKEMGAFLEAMDVGFCYREISFESKVSCPVKFAEYVANNLFTITNEGVGDLPSYIDAKFEGVCFSKEQLTDTKTMANQIMCKLDSLSKVNNKLENTIFDWSFQSENVFNIYNQIAQK